MAEGDTIDTVSVELQLESQKALEAMEDAVGKMGKIGEQFVAEMKDKFGEFVPREKLDEIVDGFRAMFTELAAEMGVIIPEPLLQTMDQLTMAIADQAQTVGDLGPGLQQLAESTLEAAGAYETIEANVNRYVAAMKEAGIEVTAQEADALAAALAQVAAKSQAAGDSAEVTARKLGLLTDAAIKAKTEAKELGESEQQAGLLTGVLDKQVGGLIGTLGRMAMGMFSLNKVLQFVIGSFRQGTQEAIKYSDANYMLGTAVLRAQEAQGKSAGTMAEWRTIAEDMAKTLGIDDAKALEAVATGLNMLSINFKITGQDAKDLMGGAANLATVMRKDVGGTIQQLAYYVGSGQKRSLARLSLDMSDAKLNAVAMAMGLGESYKALEETEKRAVRLNAVLQQTADLEELAARHSETLAGKFQAAASEAEGARKWLGFLSADYQLFFKNIEVSAIKALVVVSYFLNDIVDRGKAAKQAIDELGAGGGMLGRGLPGDQGAKIGKRAEEIYAEAHKKRITDMQTELGLLDDLEGAQGGLNGAVEDGTETVGEYGDAWEHATKKAKDAVFDAQQDMIESTARLKREFGDKMGDITRDTVESQQDAWIDYNRSLEDIDRDAYEDRVRAIVEYQQEEIRLREDHEIDMRRMEEQYLFDLEDAVRERDARAVLLLQRRYNTERKKAEEDFGVAQKRLKEEHKLELAEIERQRQLKRQQRYIQYQEELADIALQEQRKREDARLWLDRARRDLEASINARLQRIAAGLVAEYKLNYDQINALNKLLVAEYGPGGYVEQLIKYYRALVASMPPMVPGGGSGWSGMPTASPTAAASTGYSAGGGIYARQFGGSLIATGPTLLRVGEGVPERVDVSRLSGPRLPGGGNGGKVQIEMNVRADPRLIVETVEKTMSEVADVIVRVANLEEDIRR